MRSETIPLTGISILVTQDEEQADSLIKRLRELDASVIHKPTIAIHPLIDYSELDSALLRVNDFHWIIFTSRNGVDAFKKRVTALGINQKNLRNVHFAAVGEATQAALQALGLSVDFKPEYQTSAGFLREFTARYPDLTGIKILFPASKIARKAIPDGLRNEGAQVVRATAYENIPVAYPPDEIAELFKSEMVDIATFTSSSTVDNLISMIPEHAKHAIIPRIHAASIGPMTSKTLRGYGIEPVIEAQNHTLPGLVEAIVQHYLSQWSKE